MFFLFSKITVVLENIFFSSLEEKEIELIKFHNCKTIVYCLASSFLLVQS